MVREHIEAVDGAMMGGDAVRGRIGIRQRTRRQHQTGHHHVLTEVDHRHPRWRRNVGANRGDLAILNKDGAGRQDSPRLSIGGPGVDFRGSD